MIVNYHSHSRFCDGKGEPEEYVRSAIDKGFSAFGFSSHAPLPFDTDWNMRLADLYAYVHETQRLKEKYTDQIELYTGLEADYFPGCTDWRTVPGIQYTLGGVHFLINPVTDAVHQVDGSMKEFKDSLEQGFNGDIQLFGEAYYSTLRDMMMTMPPSILSHMDVFRKNNANGKFFDEDEPWYQEEIMKTLDVASLSEVIIEVNTGGMARGYMDNPYPSWWILEEIQKAGISIVLNSDVHNPQQVDFAYMEVRPKLLAIGFTKQRVLMGGVWQDVPLQTMKTR